MTQSGNWCIGKYATVWVVNETSMIGHGHGRKLTVTGSWVAYRHKQDAERARQTVIKRNTEMGLGILETNVSAISYGEAKRLGIPIR